ncbi:phosphatidylserine lipase ABHD16A isoform X4 [Phacochoerus africanus]|uniref:phosphatidylserine lipase ABHD16A isoform X4 n=1 Tax=Phacochoerus africanus TaxID=41426 RepID=UPI001FD9F941|nr:phosphatidylserine lipase ABHD16A isoform X4 [Phacochoerus africanus]
MPGHCFYCWREWPASEALAAGPTPSTGSSSPSWRQHIGTSPQRTRGSLPTTTLTSGAGQSTSTGKNPAAGRGPGGALPAGAWPCSAQSPCTGGRQTPSSTGSRSCLVRSPAVALSWPSPGAPWLFHFEGAAACICEQPASWSCYLVAHTLGRRMLYPGSVYLLQKALMPVLLQGQARLVEECNGRRAKLLACDGNEIDTMFVDRRGTAEPQGQKLVICCEGNAGFYEVGCVSTPLEGRSLAQPPSLCPSEWSVSIFLREAGYSVLGWNHPGFAGSTGVPFPQNEANAMDVVVQFAIHRLGFQPQDIIIYAWSIGGFTATWAAMSYPDISAVILDASFDDLVPLALKVMPDSWRGLVTRTVRQHLNLNNAEQLCRYQGPVLLIRRTKDEIITTTVPEDVMSNRGNDLLLKLLQHRYPRVMAEEGLRVVRQWLEASSQLEEASIYSRWEVEEDWCLSVLRSYQAEHGPEFPWSVGEDMSADGRRQLALFLAQKHLHNFEATHCTPLPAPNFQMPWHL